LYRPSKLKEKTPIKVAKAARVEKEYLLQESRTRLVVKPRRRAGPKSR